MSQDLILRPDETGRVAWSIVDRVAGTRLGAGLAEADEALVIDGLDAVDRTLCLLPAEAVFAARIALPARTDREARQAAPFAVEEELAAPLAATTVLPGRREADGSRWVFAAATARIEAWRERIAPVAVRPLHVLPDSLAVADPEAALTLYDRGDAVLYAFAPGVRADGAALTGAMDPRLFNPVITPLVRAAGEGAIAVSRSLGLAGETFRPIGQGDVDLAASRLDAARLAGFPPLFGERFLSTLDWGALVRPLVRPAVLAGLAFLAFISLMAGEGAYYRYQAARFDEASIALFRSARPDVTRRVLPAELEGMMARRIAELGGGETSSFLQLTAALAELTADNDRVTVDHLRFDRSRQALSVSARYTDFSDFDTIGAEADRLGLVVEDGGARESGNGLEGQFTVRLR